LLAVTTGSIIEDSFSSLEEREVATNVFRAKASIDSRTNHLMATAKDWGQWSDTYEFMQGDNSYVDNNLDVGSLANLQIDMMLFYDISGNLYYAAGVDHHTSEEREISAAFLDRVNKEHLLFSEPSLQKQVSGIISTPEGPMMVGTSAITASPGEETVAGTLIIAKFLDPEFVEEMEKMTQLSINVEEADEVSTLAGNTVIMQGNGRLKIDTINKDTITGTTIVDDINGIPAMSLQIEMPRDVYLQGQSAMKYALSAMMEKSVLARLTLLSRKVSAITEQGSLSSRVHIGGNDELQVLADDINYMLQTLEDNEIEFQAAEHENQQKMAIVLANIISGVMIIDPQTNTIIDVNPAAEEIIGLPKEDIVGCECHDFICSAERGKCPISDLGMSMNKSECMMLNGEGQKIWILKSVVPVTLSGKDYFVESFVDLRKIKEVEEKLIQARVAAETANRAKSDFLATMSHELRTPLNSIIGFSDLIASGSVGEISDRQKRFIENISTSGKHLLALINNVLDLSKVEANKMELHYEIFSAAGVFSEVKQLISPLAAKKRLIVEFIIENDVTTIYADKTIFKQILFNLISNAIKFTPSSGAVTISASRREDMARFTVTDTGIGISEDGKGRLFQPFTQLDSSINRQYAGTGLGLSLVKKFIEMHMGNIWVASEVGKGTTFTFELPLIKGDRNKVSPGKAIDIENALDETNIASGNIMQENSICEKPLILVVEDDDNSRELLEITLENEGYRVASASCGTEAIKLAGKLKPLAITLDIMMPGMDGWDVLKHLKEEEWTKEIPVIITSMLDDKEMGKTWGAVDYFIKPVEKDVLLATLEKIEKDASKK
jgi:PAS domain S-box-containing protein